MSPRRPLCSWLVALAGLAASLPAAPNVLFITIDDLRPALGCYDEPGVITPHLDRLAARGMVFRRAYSQQALCNPSRASFFTGLRPDSTGVHDLVTHFRRRRPDVLTLPQYFKTQGYRALAFGKIYHPAFPGFGIGSDLGDAASWSEPAWLGGPRYYYSPLGVRLARATYEAALNAKGPAPNWVAEARAARAQAEKEGRAPAAPGPDDWTRVNVRVLATEAPDVDDDELYDGQVTLQALGALRRWHAGGKDRAPLFLAVGYLKPHLPFVAPRRYWDLYDPARIEASPVQAPPRGVPAPALAVSLDELRDTYPKDVAVPAPGAAADSGGEAYALPRGPLTDAQQRQLRRGYLACISYVDAQIGRLMAELERIGEADNTVVVIVGDHGFSLGEHGLWGKQTNFEVATRAPLIICPPGPPGPGARTDALVELVDIYPTVCELAGLALPAHLEGRSAVPLWRDPRAEFKAAAVSQCPRPGLMGYSVRTDRYRLTRWQAAGDPTRLAGLELYDQAEDPGETVNLADRPEQAARVAALTKLLWTLVPSAAPAGFGSHATGE